MPGASFFRNLGLYVVEEFLPPPLCARLREELLIRQSEAATVVGEGPRQVVDENVRKVARADLAGPFPWRGPYEHVGRTSLRCPSG